MALTYGMSVKEFWEGDPDLFWAYRFSYYTKQKEEQEIINYKSWLQGLYFFEAISVSLNNAFSKNKLNYSKQPYGTKVEEEKENLTIEQNKLVAQIINRTMEVQAIKGKESSTTDKGNTEGGEIKNE